MLFFQCRKKTNRLFTKFILISNNYAFSHEGWQRKSSVERSGTEIVAHSLTQSFYGGACPNKREQLHEL